MNHSIHEKRAKNHTDCDGKSDDQVARLLHQITSLRQDTNFDLKSSTSSSQKMILEEFIKCVKLASTIFSIRSFNPKQSPAIILQSFDPKGQTKQLSSYALYYRKLYISFFDQPIKFAKIIFNIISKGRNSVNFIAYVLLPTLYNYFIDRESCEKAQELYSEIINIVQQINNDNDNDTEHTKHKNKKSDQINIQTFFPLFQSFFLSAFTFHDLLWNNFSDMFYNNEEVPHFDRFLKCIKIAAPMLTLHFPVLRNLMLYFHDEGLEFITQSFFKPSLEIYKFFFAGTDLVSEVLTILKNANSASQEILAIHEALFSYFEQSRKFVEVSNIPFSDGLPIFVTCEVMSKFIKFLKPEDEIESPKIFEMLQKSTSDLDSNNNKDKTIVLPIYFDFAKSPNFTPKKLENQHFSSIWERIKRNADEISVDPLTLLPRMNKDIEGTIIMSSEEFTLFALEEELKSLRCKKENLNYVIELTMIHQSIVSFEKTLENIVYHSYNEFIHEKSAENLQIQPISRLNRITSSFSNALKSLTKFGLPLEQCSIPLLVTVLDKITIMPNVTRLKEQFNSTKWTFQERSKELYVKEFAIFEKELDKIRKLLQTIVLCPCGQQLVKFNEVANIVQSISSICGESGIDLIPMEMFSYAFPMETGAEMLAAVVRIYQIRNVFTAENVAIPQILFQTLDVINSWLMGLLQEESRFIVDVFYPEVIKLLS